MNNKLICFFDYYLKLRLYKGLCQIILLPE